MKQRSAAYPYYSISQSLEFSDKIYKNYGKGYRATRELIAEALGVSVGSLAQKIGTAVQYGFLDVKSKEGYKVTDLFVQWKRPINEQSKKEALIEAFKNPNLYNDLINVFEGEILPPSKPLANILFQNHNISEKACDRAAQIFEENTELIDGLNEDRRLVLDAQAKEVEVEDYIQEESKENDSIFSVPAVPKSTGHDSDAYQQGASQESIKNEYSNTEQKPIPHNIPLKGKFPAQLLLPSNVSAADFDFIISYIGLIRNQY